MKDSKILITVILITGGILGMFGIDAMKKEDVSSSSSRLNDEGNYLTVSYPSSVNFRTYLQRTPLFREVYDADKNLDELQNGMVLRYDSDTSLDYASDLSESIEKGEGPDIYVLEEKDLLKFRNARLALDLLTGLGLKESQFSYQYPSLLKQERNGEEGIFCSAYEVSSGMIAYRKDIAKEVFGIDNEEEMAEKMTSLSDVNRLAEPLKEKGYTLVSAYDEMLEVFSSDSRSALVNVNRKAVSDSNSLIKKKEEDNKVEDYTPSSWLGEAKWLSDHGYCAHLSRTEDRQDYNDSMKPGSKTFLFFLTSEEANGLCERAGNSLKGKWGLIPSPVNYHRNSRFLLVNPASKNLKSARYLIEGLTLNQEDLRKTALQSKTLVNSSFAVSEARESSEDFSADNEKTSSLYNEVFAQDMLFSYSRSVKEDSLDSMRSAYDENVKNLLTERFRNYICYTSEKADYVSFTDSLRLFSSGLQQTGLAF